MLTSCLLIDVGKNPDRPRPGRLWIRNLYHVHQRLSMAFPSATRKSTDPAFLTPYHPADFPDGHVHTNRTDNTGFLFRIDPLALGRAAILVQSAIEPDWQYAFHNAGLGHLLAAPPQTKPFNPNFVAGQTLRFRLLANPTRRLSERSLGPDGQPIKKWARENAQEKRTKGMRVPVPPDMLLEWLARKASESGFALCKDRTSIQTGYLYWRKPDTAGQRLRSVRYDGTLEIADAALFSRALTSGIGPAKAFGFGLLSVAPSSNTPPPEHP